ncbi:MAG TPA: acyl carrier protein [Ignavibacteriaceae bacterium]|nr:acyl carrier protein [Ignavibacteriaceae bacterium]
MDNIQKLIKTFTESLEIEPEIVTDELSYGSSSWDSIAHLALVASIEIEFDIMLSSDEVIDMSSFKKAKEILGKRGIQF